MKQNYSLVSDHEPTDAQLKKLMHEVAQDAKQKADETNKKLNDQITKAIRAALKQKQTKAK